MPYGRTGANMALTGGAMARAIARGAVMSAPLLMTPCGSSVPVGKSTVCTFDGTASLNSIQLMRSISRVETTSRGAAAFGAEFFSVCAAATMALAAANRRKITGTEILISFPSKFISVRLDGGTGETAPLGAEDCSPRREPWERPSKKEPSPGGAKEILMRLAPGISFAPPAL